MEMLFELLPVRVGLAFIFIGTGWIWYIDFATEVRDKYGVTKYLREDKRKRFGYILIVFGVIMLLGTCGLFFLYS